MQRLAFIIATCGPVGHVPIAPGTAGSAAGLAILWALRLTESTAVEIAALGVVSAVGVWSAGVVERHLGHTDPGVVVIDEVLGMLMTVALLPVNAMGAGVGFLVFRVLDIVKPWPAGRLERLPGGLGIMADDAMAGVYGYLIMRGLTGLAPGWLT